MKRIVPIILLICLIMSLGLTACTQNAPAPAGNETPNAEKPKEKVTLNMSVTSASGSTWEKGALKFAELVNERTGGMVEIKVYPNEQLSGGNQGKGIEMLMTGATDLTYHSNIIYSIMDERFGVISLPFLFSSVEDIDKALAGEGGKAINELLLEKNVVGLGFGENGFRQLTTGKKPVRSLEDIKNMKIRIPGMKMYTSLFKALGADPLTMNFAEVFTALQQGTIDGHENPIDTIYAAKIHEVQKYITMWDYSYDAIILGMNKDRFESFDAETQQIFRDAAKEACEYQIKLNREVAEEELKIFQDAGMEIITLTEEQKQPFREAVQVVYEEYEPIMGKELIDLFRGN
ncbi:MAG TPA: DctP family TRAP transporter solute-binding subunit [Sedimentibacter sp.]|jgi:tripartite ATP-independent transporter DctP family solute receptor|nr:DctP family TRAP transporter solute-binding subunit [Sedimentibacter sp.]HOW23018.1 DctP family TRAP transporter solute-binding subunit [Sedimentibacter sp.]HRC80255.1 DctP family TRAP transporter solute-binding subunit [Sedimentibacter sp.]